MRQILSMRKIRVAILLTVVSAVCFFLSIPFPRFADFLNFRVGGVLRAVPTALSALVPFSVIEILILLMLPCAVLLFVLFVRRIHDDNFIRRSLASLLTVAMLLLSSYLLTVAPGYRTTPLMKRLGLSETEVSVASLEATARALLAEAVALEGELSRNEDGSSIMPYTLDELSEELFEAYGRLNDRLDLTSPAAARLKPVLLSDLMSQARFSGIWSYVTGEANLNVNPPDYCIPFTAAHEMAHQRGIAREDEANFVAFLVLLESDSEYLRYTAYVALFEYVASALAETDVESYRALASEGILSDGIRAEMRAYNKYYYQHKDGVISGVAGSINDAYLKLNGTSGELSYDEVVKIAVAYFASTP